MTAPYPLRFVADLAHAFESDRARDRTAVASGLRVVRIAWRRLHEDTEALAAELSALLSPGP
jgi:very-short-patch-repair endonuclease